MSDGMKRLQEIPVIAKCDGIIITPAGTVFECKEHDGHDGMHVSECGTVCWSAKLVVDRGVQMNRITGDNITDEQICELRAIAHGSHFTNRNDSLIELCDIARGWIMPEPCLNAHPSHDCVADQRRNARARCAEILSDVKNRK